jgi:hypothetical protein
MFLIIVQNNLLVKIKNKHKISQLKRINRMNTHNYQSKISSVHIEEIIKYMEESLGRDLKEN